MSAHGEQSLLDMVSKTVAAYVSRNTVTPEALPDIIRSVHTTFASLEQGDTTAVVPDAPEPAARVRKSVFPDYIVCLEDGKKLKTLKRHLHKAFGMTPDDYRQRWNLPSTYPMVAPNYAAKRSALAKSFGLGMRPQDRVIAKRPSPAAVEAHEPKPDAEPEEQVIKAGVRERKKTLVA